MDRIQVVKLTDGMEIITKVKKQGTSYRLIQPMTFEIISRGEHAGLALHFWLPIQLIDKNEVVIAPKDIIFSIEPTKEFKEYYLSVIKRMDEMIAAKDAMKELSPSEVGNLMVAMDTLPATGTIKH